MTIARNYSRCWIKQQPNASSGVIGRRLTPTELDDVVRKHAGYLTEKPGGQRALLANANLAGLDISKRILIEADFSGADLSAAKLRQSVFDGAILYSAILRAVDARFTSFRGADLRGATLKGANFSGANLEGVDLRSAAMVRLGSGGRYSRVVAESEDTAGGVDFSDCQLNGANFGNAKLVGTSFRNALLSNVKFDGASFSGVCLDGAVIAGMNPENLPFPREALRNCLLDPGQAAWRQKENILEALASHEAWAGSNGKNGASASLAERDLRVVGGGLRGRRLTALAAPRSIAVSADFSECELQGADFEAADLRNANFENADLRGANLKNANLMHANLDGAKLGDLQLVGGSIQATNLDGAKIVDLGRQLNGDVRG